VILLRQSPTRGQGGLWAYPIPGPSPQTHIFTQLFTHIFPHKFTHIFPHIFTHTLTCDVFAPFKPDTAAAAALSVSCSSSVVPKAAFARLAVTNLILAAMLVLLLRGSGREMDQAHAPVARSPSRGRGTCSSHTKCQPAKQYTDLSSVRRAVRLSCRLTTAPERQSSSDQGSERCCSESATCLQTTSAAQSSCQAAAGGGRTGPTTAGR
jgi:hypothetical protein